MRLTARRCCDEDDYWQMRGFLRQVMLLNDTGAAPAAADGVRAGVHRRYPPEANARYVSAAFKESGLTQFAERSILVIWDRVLGRHDSPSLAS